MMHLGNSAMAKTRDLIEDRSSTSRVLWKALDKIYSEISSQAVQNLVHKFDIHIFSEGELGQARVQIPRAHRTDLFNRLSARRYGDVFKADPIASSIILVGQ